MPGRVCAVRTCKSNQMKLRKEGVTLKFHYFPRGKDIVSRSIRKQWVDWCKRPEKFDPYTSNICALHFTKNDYERDLANELLGLPLRCVLKKTAVPTVYCTDDNNQDKTEETPRGQRAIKKMNKEIVASLLATTSNIFEPSTSQIVDLSFDNNSNPEPSFSDQAFDKQESQDLEDTTILALSSHLQNSNLSPDNYRERYEDLLHRYNQLKESTTKQIKSLNNMLRYYKKRCRTRITKSNTKSQISEKLLNRVLSKNQVALLSKQKRVVKWTQEEVAKAFSLRYYSKKAYVYLNDSLNYPLPALSSLRRWASRFDLRQGVLKDVLLMMKLAGEDYTAFEKTVVLQFDEVKVKSIQEYDTANDQVLGPHSQMQVVQARGLFSKWKQPVFIAFDQKVTKDILLHIISELHNISYNVVACVSDCGGGNVGLWKQLDIDYLEQPYFRHPTGYGN